MKNAFLIAAVCCLCSCGQDYSRELHELQNLRDENYRIKKDLDFYKDKISKVEKENEVLKARDMSGIQPINIAGNKTNITTVNSVKVIAGNQANAAAGNQPKEIADVSVVCPICKGTQTVRLKAMPICSACSGRGIITSDHNEAAPVSVHGSTSTRSSSSSIRTVTTRTLCNICDGLGMQEQVTNSTCMFCIGGRILKSIPQPYSRCRKCYGTGVVDFKKNAICISCAGRGDKEGKLITTSQSSYGSYYGSGYHSSTTHREMVPCQFCSGTGVMPKVCKITCPECMGLGIVK